jgi:hypothetical protein
MLVERGEKAEAVFAGEVFPITRMSAWNGEAPGLSAEDTLLLKHCDIEVTLA